MIKAINLHFNLDGRRWQVRFFREIDFVKSKVQTRHMKLLLNVKKKVPGHWMDLEVIIFTC